MLDNGGVKIKAGFAGQDAPESIFSNIIGRSKYANSISYVESYVGDQAQAKRDILSLSYPIERGIITNWDDMEKIWEHTFQKELKTLPEEHPVLLTDHPLNPLANREKMTQLLFEKFNTVATYTAIDAILSFYANGRTSGMILQSGESGTHILPIYEGYTLRCSVTRVNLGGFDMTNHLKKLLSQKGYSFSNNSAEREIIRDIKEKLTYIALDYDEESKKNDLSKSYELPDGQLITLDKERFKCPEALFNPSIMGTEDNGIHQYLWDAIVKCDIDTRRVIININL